MVTEMPMTVDQFRAKVLVILSQSMSHPLPTGHAVRRITEIYASQLADSATPPAEPAVNLLDRWSGHDQGEPADPATAAEPESSSLFGPAYQVPLPPLRIDVQPDAKVDPKAWHAFRSAAADAVVELMESYCLSAVAEPEPKWADLYGIDPNFTVPEAEKNETVEFRCFGCGKYDCGGECAVSR